MRQYKIITPDGTPMTVEGPDDATDDELISFAQDQLRQRGNQYADAPVAVRRPIDGLDTRTELEKAAKRAGVQRRLGAAEKLNGRGGIGDILENGALFGLSDEATGVADALVNVGTSPFTGDFSPVASYYDGRDAQRIRINDALEKYPVAGLGAQIVGGFLGGAPRGVLGAGAAAVDALAGQMTARQAARAGAKGGALAGGIAGFGGGTDAESSTVGGVLGAGLGGILGGAAPYVGNAVGTLWNRASRLLGAGKGESVARQIAADALIADGNTGATAGALMDRSRELGVPAMLADTGENVRSILASVGRSPGPSRTTVLNAVTERQRGQGERIRGAINRDLGPVTNSFDEGDALLATARETSRPLYAAAYAEPANTSAELQALMQTPTGRQAMSRAYRIAADERRNPASLGFVLDEAGNPVLNGAPTAALDQAAAARGELDAAQSAYRAARDSADGASMEAARSRIENARATLRTVEQALAEAPAEGSAAIAGSPTVQTLDYVKRGIDDVLDQYRSPLTGRLQLDEAGRAVEGVRSQFVSEVDRLHPGNYAAARAAYAGPAASRQVLQEGADALNWSPQELSRRISHMDEGQVPFFAQGYRNSLANNLEHRVDGGDKAGALMGTPAKRQALETVFPGEGLDRFGETLAAEQAANQTYRSVAAGSQTAERMAADELTSDTGLTETAMGAALRGAQGGWAGLLSTGVRFLGDKSKFGTGEAGKEIRQSLASMLTETDPALLQEIIRNAGADALARQRAANIGNQGAALTGQQLSVGLTTAGSNLGR